MLRDRKKTFHVWIKQSGRKLKQQQLRPNITKRQHTAVTSVTNGKNIQPTQPSYRYVYGINNSSNQCQLRGVFTSSFLISKEEELNYTTASRQGAYKTSQLSHPSFTYISYGTKQQTTFQDRPTTGSNLNLNQEVSSPKSNQTWNTAGSEIICC